MNMGLHLNKGQSYSTVLRYSVFYIIISVNIKPNQNGYNSSQLLRYIIKKDACVKCVYRFCTWEKLK